jgi:hypothetical protein
LNLFVLRQKTLLLHTTEKELPKMRFHFSSVSSSLLWPFLVFACLALVLIKRFQLVPADRNWFNSTELPSPILKRTVNPRFDTISTVGSNFNDGEGEVLPGIYNLLEDAKRHSNALDRPTKECTQGKSITQQTNVFLFFSF